MLCCELGDNSRLAHLLSHSSPSVGTLAKSNKEVIHTQVQDTAVGNMQRKRWAELAWGLWAGWNCPTRRGEGGGRKEVQATAPWQEMNFRDLHYFLVIVSSPQDLAVWLRRLFFQSRKVRPPVSIENMWFESSQKFCLEPTKLPQSGVCPKTSSYLENKYVHSWQRQFLGWAVTLLKDNSKSALFDV